MLTCNLDKKLCDIIGFKGAWLCYAVTSSVGTHCTYLQNLQLCFGGCHSTVMKSVIH